MFRKFPETIGDSHGRKGSDSGFDLTVGFLFYNFSIAVIHSGRNNIRIFALPAPDRSAVVPRCPVLAVSYAVVFRRDHGRRGDCVQAQQREVHIPALLLHAGRHRFVFGQWNSVSLHRR